MSFVWQVVRRPDRVHVRGGTETEHPGGAARPEEPPRHDEQPRPPAHHTNQACMYHPPVHHTNQACSTIRLPITEIKPVRTLNIPPDMLGRRLNPAGWAGPLVKQKKIGPDGKNGSFPIFSPRGRNGLPYGVRCSLSHHNLLLTRSRECCNQDRPRVCPRTPPPRWDPPPLGRGHIPFHLHQAW